MSRRRRGFITLAVVALAVTLVAWLTREPFSERQTTLVGASVDAATSSGGAAALAAPAIAESLQSRNTDGRQPLYQDARTVSEADRLDAISRAHVWQQPRVPVGEA